MKVLVGAVAIAVVGWFVEPWIAMAKRGTLDEQTIEGWRQERPIPRPRGSPESGHASTRRAAHRAPPGGRVSERR